MTGSLPLMLWVVGAVGLVGLLVFGCIFAFDRRGMIRVEGQQPASLMRWVWPGAVVLAGTLILWSLLERPEVRDFAIGRRALDSRATELTLRTLAPGSPLACLEAIDNAVVEDACENAVFGSGQATAAALAYVDAKLTLLADSLQFAGADRSYEANLARLRRGLEADRFGLVAQALATRGCSDDKCPEFKLLRDPKRVAANLKGRVFDANVAMHSPAWREPALASAPAADAEAGTALAAAPHPSGVPVSSRYDFPSASSIPPVSIMNPEPAAAPAPAAAAKPAASSRRQAVREAPAPAAPMTIVPESQPPAAAAPAGTLANPR